MIIDVLLRKHKKLGGVNIFTKQVSVHVKTTYVQYIISMLLNYTSDLNRVFRFCLFQQIDDLITEATLMIITVHSFEYHVVVYWQYTTFSGTSRAHKMVH